MKIVKKIFKSDNYICFKLIKIDDVFSEDKNKFLLYKALSK
jgi:hypothetical protein